MIGTTMTHLKRVKKVTFTFVLFVFGITSGYGQNNNFFSWDADSTTIIVDGASSNCISLKGGSVIDTNEKHSGSGSIRHTLSDSQRDLGCDPLKEPAGAEFYDGGEMYFRWWMKIASDMNWGTYTKKTKIARLKRANEKNPGFATLYLYHNKIFWEASDTDGSEISHSLKADFDPGDGTCRSSENISDLGADCTEWREYILYVKRNTCSTCSDAALMLYIDRQLADITVARRLSGIQPADGVTQYRIAWSGAGGKIFPQLCPNGEVCNFGGFIWFDDMSVDSTWNSTLGPTPQQDAIQTN